MELTKFEEDCFRDLLTHAGWKVYLKMLEVLNNNVLELLFTTQPGENKDDRLLAYWRAVQTILRQAKNASSADDFVQLEMEHLHDEPK